MAYREFAPGADATVRDFHDFANEAPSVLLANDELARHFLSHSSKTAAVRRG